ncbi:MAG: hypothetical protein OXF20_15555 [Gammaproteobacteria bacterium]|nr:hypothetical protein [Gammaproteobacteria bacterium]
MATSPESVTVRSRGELGVQLYRAALGAGLPLCDAEDLLQAAPFMSKWDVTQIAKDLDQNGKEIRELLVSLDQAVCGKELPPLGTLGTALARSRGLDLKNGVIMPQVTASSGDRIEIEAETWGNLDSFARKIYVQESVHSRLTGAGTGTEED